MSSALRRAATTPLLVGLILLCAGVAVAGAALVGFSAEARNQSSVFAAGWLGAPTPAAPAALGDGATLTWTPATHGLRAGTDAQAITGSLFASNPTDCNSATYSDFSTTGLATSVSTTNDTRGSAFSGYWACYRVESRRATWSTGANFSLVQIGLVPTGIAAVSVGPNLGQAEQSDRIDLNFNQGISYSGTSTITVCTFSGTGTGSILIGASSCSSASNTTTIGKVTGLTIGNSRTFSGSTVAVSGSSLRISLVGNQRTTVSAVSPAFTYTGSSTLITSSGGSPVAQVCTVTARCPWTVSGSF